MNFFIFILQFLVLMAVVCGVIIFVLRKVLFDSTQGAVNRLQKDTEAVRAKQTELNQKIKEANEELQHRRSEADSLVLKMKTDAEEVAKQEREKIIAKARAEGEEIIAKAQKTKDDMRKALEKEMELKAVDFMIILAEEIFSEKVRASLNHDLIDEFLDSFQKTDMSMISESIAEADVVSAIPLEEKFRTRLSDILQKKLGRTIALKYTEDKKILAGMVVHFENLRLDGSLAHIMKEKGVDMKERLERGLL